MIKEFEVEISEVKKMIIRTSLHVDTGITLDELVEDLKYQAEVVAHAILSGDSGYGVITSSGVGFEINSIKLIDEVKIVK